LKRQSISFPIGNDSVLAEIFAVLSAVIYLINREDKSGNLHRFIYTDCLAAIRATNEWYNERGLRRLLGLRINELCDTYHISINYMRRESPNIKIAHNLADLSASESFENIDNNINKYINI
jgi:hypothetical protein